MWVDGIYRCGFGHRHVITVQNAPLTLIQPHGRFEGRPPRCNAMLTLVKTVPRG